MGDKLSLLGRPVLSSMNLSSIMALHCITLLDIVKNNIEDSYNKSNQKCPQQF